jgi:hypothetical protein
MRRLSAEELLSTWEEGYARPPPERAVLLISRAMPGAKAEEIAGMSIGERDLCLMSLRDLIFGPEIISTGACPECGEDVELAFSSTRLRASKTSDPGAGDSGKDGTALEVQGYHICFRLPSSLDIMAISGMPDIACARKALAERCILEARAGDEACTAESLPDVVLDALSARMGEMDPQGDIQVKMTCPSCGCVWAETFDIESFLWSEVQRWALATMRDIHILASCYGWGERDILAISPWRRRVYIEMVGK